MHYFTYVFYITFTIIIKTKPMLIIKLLRPFLIYSILLSPLATFCQVKIGDVTGAIIPQAVLELKDSARGFLLPRLNQAQMNGIASPPDGLLVFNNTSKSIYQYNLTAGQWKPIVADSSEWFYDTATTKLFFRRALANGDSLYYNTGSKKWIFADNRIYRTSTGGTFNLDEGNSDRFIFKTTASKFPRPATNLNSANVYSVYEVDNDTIAVSHPYEANYYGFSADATVIPSATQKIGFISGMRSIATFAGTDTMSVGYGFQNIVTMRGKGFAEIVAGINSSVNIRDSVSTLGTVYGIQNRFTYTSPLGIPRVAGNLYGYFSTFSTAMNGKVDGNAYGIFLGNITQAGPTNNYGIFTSKGPNRFGDSVLVTDGFASRPRSVLDVNATSAMIIPVGTTLQRPATAYTGMLRYNTDNASPEAFTGATWVNVKPPILSATALVDPPLIANNTTATINYAFTGVAVGNTVSISPAAALPSGIVIAWANVSAANQVTIGFANFSGAVLDLPAQNFYIKVIQ
jgi:hypothetical protein